MKSGQELYNEHLKRIQTVFNLEKPDRTPINFNADLFALKYGDPTAVAADYVRRPEWAAQKVFEGVMKLGGGEIDAASNGYQNPKACGLITLGKSKVPGRDLKEDALWQIDEVGIMTDEDYDTILNKGWAAFTKEFIFERLGYTPDDMADPLDVRAKSSAQFKEAGIVEIISTMPATTPFNQLMGARGLVKFAKDMRNNGDKLAEVLAAITDENCGNLKKQVEQFKPLAVFSGGSRASEDYISAKYFEKFVWPTTQKTSKIIIEGGSRVWFHLDSNWESRLPYFTEFPKATCIFDPDGMTDIFKIKEILGDRMCITGDLQPGLLCVGTPDEVYDYSMRLINEIGPSGFLMAAGCCVPPNARPANMEAVVAACLGK